MPVTRTAVLAAALMLIGCESTEKKAARLRSDMATACLAVAPGMISGDDITYPAKQAKCDVATRDFNTFMAGK